MTFKRFALLAAVIFPFLFSTITAQNSICHVAARSESGQAAKIVACAAALPATGGTIDQLLINGNWTSDPLAAISKNIALILPNGTTTQAVNTTSPINVTLVLQEGAVLAPASMTTLTINGPVSAAAYQIFSGAGVVSLVTNRVQKILWVEWWGAKGDNSTDNSAALTAAFVALPNGSTMRFASYSFYLTSTELVLDHKFQVTLLGNDSLIGYADNSTKPIIVYNGHAAGVEAVLKCNNCYASTIQGLGFYSNDGQDLTKGAIRGIYLTFTAGGYPSLSSRNKISYCTISAVNTQTSWIGIDINNISGANNEHHSIVDNLIQGSTPLTANSQTGINLGHSQVKAIEINRNGITDVGTGVSVQGSMRATNNSFNSIDIVWSFGYLVDEAYVFGDDIETINHYISTNQHPGANGITFIGNRVSNIAALGDSVNDYWVKTVGNFTFIDNSMIADSLYNVRAPGPYVFQGDGLSPVYFEDMTIQAGQFGFATTPVGLETMNATVVDGAATYRFGGASDSFGATNLQAVPTDYIARKTINSGGPANQVFGGLYIGDNDIKIDALYQEYDLSVTATGTTGSTVYWFAVVGVDSLGRRSFTSLGTTPADRNLYVAISNANATLSGSNYLAFKWPSQLGRPPATWSIYEINQGNPFQWRPVATGIANTGSVEFQTKNVTANWGGSFVTRPFVNETSDVGIPGRLIQPNTQTFTDLATTPSVAIGNRFIVSNSMATSVSNFTNGTEGQIIYVQCTTGNTTFVHGSTIKNRAGSNVTAAANTLKAYQLFSSVWYEQF